MIFLICLLFSFNVYADKISAPPQLSGEPVAEQHYWQEIYNNFHVLEVTTTAPNGNRKGVIGKMIIYNNSGTFELWINTTGLTVWQQI